MSMSGLVVDRRPTVPVTFRLPERGDLQLHCVVDTGFSGAVTLPFAAIEAMGLAYLEDVRVNLANDTYTDLPVYSATIVWNSLERRVRVLASGRLPLLGVTLLFDNLLGIDFIDQGLVTIRARSQM